MLGIKLAFSFGGVRLAANNTLQGEFAGGQEPRVFRKTCEPFPLKGETDRKGAYAFPPSLYSLASSSPSRPKPLGSGALARSLDCCGDRGKPQVFTALPV